MRYELIVKLEELLYSADMFTVCEYLSRTVDAELLHQFIANYNWSNGFDAPRAVLSNTHCDLGTGLLAFYSADGLRLLMEPNSISESVPQEWLDFLRMAYVKINGLEFRFQRIAFDAELSRVQKYKLKKMKPDIPDVFIETSPGEMVEILTV